MDAVELAQREKKANNISLQYNHLVKVMELSDVGIFSCDKSGNLLQANESWYRLSSFSRQAEPVPAFAWLESVYDDDKALVMSNWNSMLQGKPVTVGEARLLNITSSADFSIVSNEVETPRATGRTVDFGCLSSSHGRPRQDHKYM